MSNRQDMTSHSVILATKTYEIRYRIDPYGADEEAEESQDAVAATVSSPGAQLTPVSPAEDLSKPVATSAPP